ncbi:hypothetical protein EV182_004893, partial [Spiromyces aspiralis]
DEEKNWGPFKSKLSPSISNDEGTESIGFYLYPDDGIKWLRWIARIGSDSAADGISFLETPLLISITGRVTAYLWVDGHLLGRHHGFKILNTASSADASDVETTTFAWFGSSSSSCTIKVMLYGWRKDIDPSLKLGAIPVKVKTWVRS